MSFCKISSLAKHKSFTLVSNAFCNDFLLSAPAECVKVYLWGLFLAQNSEEDNTIEKMSADLNISAEDILNIFLYWQEKGVVQVIQLGEPQVIYKPAEEAVGNLKKFKVGKYNDFNVIIQQLFPNRTITTNEFTEYYTVIESFHMDMEALIEIAKYAISLKGESVGHRYITTIAKSWANEKILTKEQVLAKIKELSTHDDKLVQVMHALGNKSAAQIEDKELLDSWLNDLGFEFEVIIHIAKYLHTKMHKTDMRFLDMYIHRYFEMKLLSIQEIDEYETNKSNLLSLAKDVTRALGLYYQDCSQVVDVYILPLVQMGYSYDLLVNIANYCFRSSIRTLEGYADMVQKLYKLGILNMKSFDEYMADLVANDRQVRSILETLGLSRRVTENDRAFYRTWTTDWAFGEDIINYAASLSVGKPSAIIYMNRLLSNWHRANISTLEAAKSFIPDNIANTNNKATQVGFTHEYTSEELSTLFSNLDEVEV